MLYDVFGKSTVQCDAAGVEVLTQKRLPTSTIEAVFALHQTEQVSALEVSFLRAKRHTHGNAYVGNATVSDLEAFDIFAHFYNRADGFVARDQLNGKT